MPETTILLYHELQEYKLMNEQGESYRIAHDAAEKQYNYARYIKELDAKEGLF